MANTITRRGLASLALCLLSVISSQHFEGQGPSISQVAMAHSFVDQEEEARLRASIKVAPGNVEAVHSLAILLERTGRPRSAVALRRALLRNSADKARIPGLQLDLATSLVETGKSEEAIPLLQALVRSDPGNEPAQFELATALARTENFTPAIEAFIRAVQLNPEDQQAQLSTAKALVTLLRYSEAESYLNAAFGSRPLTAEGHILRGIIDSHTDRNMQALTAFRAALAQEPKDANAMLLLGESLLREHHVLQAIEVLERSAAALPSVATYFQLTKAYRAVGDAPKQQAAIALLHVMQEQQFNKTKADSFSNSAEQALVAKEYKQAVAAYQSAFLLRPTDIDLLYREAIATGLAGDRAEELRLLHEVIRSSPDSVNALTEAGILEGLLGNNATAKEYLQRAVHLNPERADALNNLAVLLAQEGAMEPAKKMLTDAIESDPLYSCAFRSLGLILAAESRFSEAETFLKQSISVDPSDSANHFALGNVYLSRQDLSNALAEFQAASLLQPGAGVFHLAIARTLWVQGKPGESLSELHKALTLEPNNAQALAFKNELCDSVELKLVPIGCWK